MNDKHSVGVASKGSTASSTMSATPCPKAMEAQTISQATATAIVAAQSILLSGGSEDVALKTAKKAAESVLNPSASDADTISARSTTFLRRRKAKRQAEVVASMALMTASANIRDGLSSDWSAAESNPGSFLNPYARNITTRSMNTQDEPSVLSGSTRPPKPPTPKAGDPQDNMTQKRNIFVVTEMDETERLTNSGVPPKSPVLSPKKSPLVTQAPPTASGFSSHKSDSPKPAESPTPRSLSEILEESDSADVKSKIDMLLSTNSNSSDEDDGTTDSVTAASSMSADRSTFHDESTFATREVAFWEGPKSNTSSWKELEPLLNVFTTALNLLTCEPTSAFIKGMVEDKVLSTGSAAGDENTVFSNEETTYDDRDDEATDFRSLESDEPSGRERMLLDPSSSESFDGSESFLRELHSTSASEAEIQVKSTIRDTMESILSMSKQNLRSVDSFDKKWLSYEFKQDIDFSTQTANPSTKPKISPKSKRSFFFKRGSNRASF